MDLPNGWLDYVLTAEVLWYRQLCFLASVCGMKCHFSPINRTVCTSVFFFTEKCALCWIAHQLFQTRNVKVLKLPVVLKTDVLFSLTCCGHRARCFTNSPLLEYKLEASEVIVEVSVRSSAEIETTLKKIWIPSKAIFPYSS